MAPILINVSQSQPDILMRQNEASPIAVTLSITRATTTYTTTMILGSATPIQSSSPETLTAPNTASTPTGIVIPATSPENGSQGALIGGILGGILGFFFLATIVWKCCYDNRSALTAPDRRSRYYSDSDSDRDSDSNSTGSARIRRRGGGGSAFGRRHRRRSRSGGIRRPERVYSRREGERESERYRRWDREDHGRSRSAGSKSDRMSRSGHGSRRPGGMVYRNGILGWRLGATVKPRYVETRESVRWSSSGKGVHGGGGLRFNVGDD